MALSLADKAICRKCMRLNNCYIEQNDPNWFVKLAQPEKGGYAENEQTADEESTQANKSRDRRHKS